MAEDAGHSLKKILLMGLRNSGKTSIHRVVFEGVDAHETQHQQTSTRTSKVDAVSNAFVKFQVWDFPGQHDWINDPPQSFNFRQFLEGCGAIVFVIDVSAEDTLQEAQDRMIDIIAAAHPVNSTTHFEVFLHKVDKLTAEAQEEVLRRLSSSIQEQVQLQVESSSRVRLTFHLTSIFDHSIFKGFSLVVQKIVPQLPHLRAIIEMLTANSRLQQAMLFDTTSRIFIAADNSVSTTDSGTYELFVEALQLSGQLGVLFPSDDRNNAVEDSLLANQGENAFTSTPYDKELFSLMHFGNGKTVYVKEVGKTLALVVSGDDSAFLNRSLIDYNIGLFCRAVIELFTL